MTSQVRIPSEKFSNESRRYDLVDLPFMARVSRWVNWVIIPVFLIFAVFMVASSVIKLFELGVGPIGIASQDLVMGSIGIIFGLSFAWVGMYHIDMVIRKSAIVLMAEGFKDGRSRLSADWRSVVSAVPFGVYYVRGIQLRFAQPVEMTIPFGIGRFALLWTLRRRQAVIFTTGLDQSSSLVEKIILELISRSFDADAGASVDRERPASPSITSPASVVVQA